MCFSSGPSKSDTNAQIQAQNNQVTSLIAAATQQRQADQDAQKTLLATLTTTSQNQIDALNKQNATLLTSLGDQAGSFAKSQQDLIKAQNDATTQAADQAKALLNLRDQTAQAVKQPDYSAILKRNKDLNSTGLSSTMLTGSAGVSTGSLALGTPTLLGA